jgi:ClpP class serine protease
MEALQGKPENYIAEFLDPVNAAFENAVATNRKGKVDLAKEDVMTGKIYTGSAAVNVGLADKIGTLDYAIKRSLQLANSF